MPRGVLHPAPAKVLPGILNQFRESGKDAPLPTCENHCVSFDLAVRECDRPANDIEAAQAIDYAVALAAERGLVCYDPQYSILR